VFFSLYSRGKFAFGGNLETRFLLSINDNNNECNSPVKEVDSAALNCAGVFLQCGKHTVLLGLPGRLNTQWRFHNTITVSLIAPSQPPGAFYHFLHLFYSSSQFLQHYGKS
jgi:hypothetical protein